MFAPPGAASGSTRRPKRPLKTAQSHAPEAQKTCCAHPLVRPAVALAKSISARNPDEFPGNQEASGEKRNGPATAKANGTQLLRFCEHRALDTFHSAGVG